MKTDYFKQKIYIFLFLILVAYTGLFAFRSLVSVDIMEARNYVTAREMVQERNWLVPTLNGELRIAKPPLPTWVTAGFFLVSGTDNNLAFSRIPSALAGLVMLISAYFVSLYLTRSKRAGIYSAVVLATSYMFFYMVRKNTWDIYAIAFMSACAAFLCFAISAEKYKVSLPFYAAAGVCAAFSFMSKGPVAFYAFLLPFLCALFYYNRFKNLSKLGIAVFITVLASFSFIWYGYIYLYEANTVSDTAAAEISAWADRHIKPFWYYVQFPSVSGIWAVFLIPLLFPAFSAERLGKKKAYFYLIWIFLTVVLLSLIPEKKDRYLLPVTFPCALLIGDYLSILAGGFRLRISDAALTIFCRWLVLFVGCAALGGTAAVQMFYGTISYAVFAPLWLALFASVFAFYLFRENKLLNFPVCVVCICCSVLIIMPFGTDLVKDKDFRVLEKVRTDTDLKGASVFGDMGIKEIWAVGRKVRPLGEYDASAPALFISNQPLSDNDTAASALEYTYIKTYTSEGGKEWIFYRVQKKIK